MRASIGPRDPDYPQGLLATSRPALRVAGQLPAGPAVAIVGSRTASAEALGFTRLIAQQLAHSGVVVWSGGALGIDTQAHEGALDAGMPTVVVLGGGLDCLYPEENAALFERVQSSRGALLSMFDDDAPALPPRFLRRNELLAAATAMTLVVECGLRSGARSTAARAHKLGRPVGVVLQAPWAPFGSGCYAEHLRGARVIQSAGDVLDVVAAGQQLTLFPEPSSSHQGQNLTDLERSVVLAVQRGAATVDDLCAALTLPVSSVSALVMDLTLKGELCDTPHGLRPAPGTCRTAFT